MDCLGRQVLIFLCSHFPLVLTKRNVLKKTASVYDPFGFLTPFVVRAKMLMQEAWIEALGWDEESPDHFKMEWKRWFGELGAVRVSRCLKEDKELRDVTIHTFSDASEKAYAAATYVRHEHSAVRTHGSTDWSPTDTEDMCSTGAS